MGEEAAEEIGARLGDEQARFLRIRADATGEPGVVLTMRHPYQPSMRLQRPLPGRWMPALVRGTEGKLGGSPGEGLDFPRILHNWLL